MMKETIFKELDLIDEVAKNDTTCLKTYVGCSLGYEDKNGNYVRLSIGVNKNARDNCKQNNICFRKRIFGSDSKEFRKYCRAVHAEINALNSLKENEKPTIAIVTRYPCDACALKLCKAGIKKVYYARSFMISDFARELFNEYEVEVKHILDWECSDKNDNNR